MLKMFYLFLLPIFLFASDVNIADSDIIERTINFIIFIVILWYLFANKIKESLKDRQRNIADQLNAVQDKLSQSMAKKEEAYRLLEESKQKAKEIVLNAKKEAEIIADNINKQCNIDIAIINKNHQERISFEHKKIKKMIINDVIDELLLNNINLSKNDYIDILLKRVA